MAKTNPEVYRGSHARSEAEASAADGGDIVLRLQKGVERPGIASGLVRAAEAVRQQSGVARD